jgi:hypothetical protein
VTLQLLRDDGAVVYLNGKEVVRSNMPAGTITSTTFASTAISGAAETTFSSFSIPVGAFVNGTNTLAVEIHQSSSADPDLSFGLSLKADIAIPGPTGATGPSGQTGPAGPTGPQGLTGAAGATGAAGIGGAMGPAGPTGPQSGRSLQPGPTEQTVLTVPRVRRHNQIDGATGLGAVVTVLTVRRVRPVLRVLGWHERC